MRPAVTLSRRAVLGLAAAALAGCQRKAPRRRAPVADPDAAAMATARQSEQQLLAMYDAAIATATGDTGDLLGVERAEHAAHLAALEGATVAATTPTSVPPFQRLTSLLRESADTLHGLAIAAVEGGNAAVLASIAASHTVRSR